MSTVRLNAFPAKTAPIAADILYLGDSANLFTESKTTISQLIGNNKIPTFTGTITGGNLTLWNDSTTQKDSGITVDGSRNLTNVGTINGFNLYNFLVSSNNLADLSNIITARTNLGLGSAATKNASSSDSTVAAVHGTITPGHVAYFYDSAGTLVDGGTTSQFLQVTNNLNDVQSKSASRINLSVPAVTAYDGNPNGNVAGTINDLCQDTLTPALYMCATTGSASTAVWQPVMNLSGAMFRVNNLSDVQNDVQAFNNISPLTTKGDVISFDGTNNVRIAAGSNGYVLTADSTQTAGVKWAPTAASTGFVDNALYVGTSGQIISSATPTPVNLNTLLEFTTGNTWTTNGDNTGMKCGAAGTYLFNGVCPIASNSSSVADYGILAVRFAKNGTAFGPIMPYNGPLPRNGNAKLIVPVECQAIVTCAVNDVITFCVYSGTNPNTYQVPDPLDTGVAYSAQVSITRLT